MTGHFSDYIGHEYRDQKITIDPQSSMFTLAIRSGLIEYIQAKIEEDDTALKKSGRPLLDYIARPPNKQMGIEAFKADCAPLKIAALLFATGSAPNEAFDSRTPWQTFLLHLNIGLGCVMGTHSQGFRIQKPIYRYPVTRVGFRQYKEPT